MSSLRIGVIDDEWAISAGVLSEMHRLLELAPGSRRAASVAELLADGAADYDVVVLDVQLANGTAAADNVAALRDHGSRVAIYTHETRLTVLSHCIEAGALAIIAKRDPPEVLAEAVGTVAAGEAYLNADWALVVEWMESGRIPRLSPREKEVLSLFASGLPLKSVARRVSVSEKTAKEHIDRVRIKYNHAGRPAATKADLYFRGVEDGHIPLPTERHA